jgi:hypothetical protein
MNRKLHNTVMALIASSSLFVLGLLTASPALSPAPAHAVATAFDADHAVAAEVVDHDAKADQASPRRQIRRPRQQSVAMPFFSFAPRG